jgi:hypothetical protein
MSDASDGLGAVTGTAPLKSTPCRVFALSYDLARESIQFSIGELTSAMESGFQCAGCGEWNTTSVDETAGRRQSYVEDCQVCCKPNLLQIEYDTPSQEFFIAAALE